MGDQNQGRSGVKELNKTLSLNKKSREVSFERQTSARDSQIAELRSVEVAPSAKPTESPPDVKRLGVCVYPQIESLFVGGYRERPLSIPQED